MDFPTVLRLVNHLYSEPFTYSDRPDSDRGGGGPKCPRPPRIVNNLAENSAKSQRMKQWVVAKTRVHVHTVLHGVVRYCNVDKQYATVLSMNLHIVCIECC